MNITEAELDAIDSLVCYNWQDELRDYCINIEEMGKGCHIFESIVILDNLVRRSRGQEAVPIETYFSKDEEDDL